MEDDMNEKEVKPEQKKRGRPPRVESNPEPIKEVKELPVEKPSGVEPKFVSVLYGASGGWYFEDASYGPNDVVKFEITKRPHLHALMQLCKIMNNPKVNKVAYLVKNSPDGENTKYHIKWTIIEGNEHIPKSISEMKFTANDKFTPEQIKDIKSLVPTYFEIEEKLYKVRR